MPAVIALAASALFAQPATRAELFAEGTLSGPATLGITFAQDGATAYIGRFITPGGRWQVLVSRLENGVWGSPAPAGFSGEYSDGNPYLSPDGSRLYFWSLRPLDGQPAKQSALWVVENANSGWGVPKHLGSPVNIEGEPSANPAVAANGNVYFSTKRPDSVGDLDIYVARPIDGRYPEVHNLGAAINTPEHEFGVYIAPDESYMILASDRPGGLGKTDLYVSVQRHGKWTPPRNLGPAVNTEGTEMCPTVSPDGKRLFFSRIGSGKSGIYSIELSSVLP